MGETAELLRLWLLGVVWAYGSWVALALALGGAVLLFGWLDRLAAAVESGPIEDGWRGVPEILRNRAALAALVAAAKIAIVGAVALAGVAVVGLQGFVAEQLEAAPPPAPSLEAPFSKEMSLDFILLGALVVLAMSIAACVLAWRALRSRATAWAQSPPPGTAPPLFVRLYRRPRLAGVLLLLLATYLVFGLVMQLFYLLVLLLPLPGWLRTLSVPGTNLLAILALTLLWLGLVFVMAAPFAQLGVRRARLWLREVTENRVAGALFKLSVTALAFLAGFLFDTWLLQELGATFFSRWFG